MCNKVKCFTKIESKCLITNNKKRGPETVFVPARETTFVGSEKMGKCEKKRIISNVILPHSAI